MKFENIIRLIFVLRVSSAGLNERIEEDVITKRPSPVFLVQDSGKSIKLVQSWPGEQKSDNVTVVLENQDLLAAAVDFSFQDQLIFYVDDQETLRSISLHTKETKEICSGHGSTLQAFSLSVDWITKKVYWALEHQIATSNFDGSHWKVLFHERIESVRSMNVDPIHGYMFWINGYYHEIERAWMDGTHRSPLVKTGEHPNSLSVDFGESSIYWSETPIEGSEVQIKRVHFDGKNVRVLASHLRALYLVVYQNSLYWHSFDEEGIESCYKVFCKNVATLARSVKPEAFRIFERNSQPSREYNPCLVENGNCSHLCLLIPESPYRNCACPTGIRLLEDGLTCAEGPEEVLVVATRKELKFISLDTPDFTSVTISLEKTVEHAVAVDFDPIDGFIYWTDGDLKKIRRARLNGTDESDIITTELHQSDGIAVDWIARNVYWTDTGLDRIEVARLNGSCRRVLISTGLGQPRAITLDPIGGFIYWSDWNDQNPRIEKAYMDGSNRLILIDFGPLHWPNGLALDKERKWIYWIDGSKDEISCASALDGSQRRQLVTENVPHMFGLTMLDDWLYWTDWQRRSIERVKSDGTERQLVGEMPDVMGIKAVNLNRLPEGTNECAYKNGQCSHLCLYRPTGRICLCAVGWELAADNRTCLQPDAYLMFSQNQVFDLMRISLSPHRSNLDKLRLHNVSQPLAIDFHFTDGHVYWTSGVKSGNMNSQGAIQRAFFNGSHMETLINPGVQYMEGLAVDWVARNLYWSEWNEHRIEASRLDGSCRTVIVWRNTLSRAIIVHPTQGYLYWADWRDPPTLQRSELDGKNRLTLLSDVGRIYSMSLDVNKNRLFWSAIDDGGLYSADINGGSQKKLLSGIEPYAMTYFDGSLYWASWRTSSIEMCDAETGSNRSVLHTGLRQLMNLIAVHPLKQNGWNQCALGNGQCEHLCFAVPNHRANGKGSYRCGCSTHYDLKDDKFCHSPKSFLLVADNNHISRWKISSDLVNYRTDDIFHGYPTMTMPYQGLHNPRSLQYDPLNRMIYWIDSLAVTSVVRYASDNETKVKSLTLPHCEPFSMALDLYGRQLFVNCGQKDMKYVIRVFRLKADGSVSQFQNHKDQIVNRGQPQQIAIHPRKRALFYVDVEGGSRIVKCELDGRHCNVWPDAKSRRDLLTPTSLMVDVETDSVYWLDQEGIRSAKIDGSKNNRLIQYGHREVVMTTFGWRLFVAPLRDSEIRMFDRENEQIAKESDGMRVTQSNKRLRFISGIIAINDALLDDVDASPCLRHHRCSHMCSVQLSNGEKKLAKVCLCPLGMTLSRDGKTCRPNVQCQQWQFACKSGQECIHMQLRCDGNPDCQDNSDESRSLCDNCQGPSTWRCLDGKQCLGVDLFCDGTAHCDDGSDENHCFCPQPTGLDRLFDCTVHMKIEQRGLVGSINNKRCIERERTCDKREDCIGGEDESQNFCKERSDRISSGTGTPKPSANGVNSYYGTLTIVFAAVIGVFLLFCVLFLILLACRRRPASATNSANQTATIGMSSFPSAGTHTDTLYSRDRVPLVQLHVNQQVFGDPSCSFGSFERFHQRSVPSGKSNTSSSLKSSDRIDPGVPPNSEVSYANASEYFERPPRRHRRHRKGVGYEYETERLYPATPPPPYDNSDHMTPCSTEVMAGASMVQMPSTSASSAVDEPPLMRNPPPSPQTSVRSQRSIPRQIVTNRRSPRTSPNQSQADSDYYVSVDPYQNPPPSPANGSSDS